MIQYIFKELLIEILREYIKFDICTLSRLSITSKKMLSVVRDNSIWVPYYYSLFPQIYKLTPYSEHKNEQTYFKCGLGEYPGWKHINDPIKFDNKNPLKNCKITNHYSNTEKILKSVRWKSVFHMCAKRKYTIMKNKFKVSNFRLGKIRRLKRELERLERPLRQLNHINDVYDIHIRCMKNDYS